MKKSLIFLFSICLLFSMCQKYYPEPESISIIVEDPIINSAIDVTIEGSYEYMYDVDELNVVYGSNEDLSDTETRKATLKDKKFSASLTGLNAKTRYYYCIEVWVGETSQKTEVYSFITSDIEKPIVTTLNISDVTFTSAICGGNVTSDGGAAVTERGICWGTSHNPVITGSHTTDGTGTGEFTRKIDGLTENTTYYIRAYAKNSEGIQYGNEVSFRTDDEIMVNGVSFTMVNVKGGTFQMGATSEQGDDAGGNEKPVHSVTLSDYYIAETEVTQELWEAVMGDNPSGIVGTNKPVNNISWNDCQEFITKLNQLTGKNFRLPTEAEWEYAARGGVNSKGYKYSGSNIESSVAVYSGYDDIANVKSKLPNELGVYDMSGNVLEWCQDYYGAYDSSSQVDPQGPSYSTTKVLRGGGIKASSYEDCVYDCRVSTRINKSPENKYYNYIRRCYIYGFRLAL